MLTGVTADSELVQASSAPTSILTVNREMSLETIAALLGHRSLDMTLRYAKIANRTVTEEYFAVADQTTSTPSTHPPQRPLHTSPVRASQPAWRG